MIAEQILRSGVALSICMLGLGILLVELTKQVRRIADALTCAKEMQKDADHE